MIETHSLQHLVAVAKHLHFGNASRELGIGQPALSKSIQRLEALLGAKLLDRSHKRVSLTPIGVVVVQRAKQLIDDARELEREVKLMRGGEIGSLIVGIGPAMSETFVPTAIARTAEQHPQARIQVIAHHWEDLTKLLFERKIDILIADIAVLQSDNRVKIVPLPAESVVWFCRRGHPLVKMRNLKRADLFRFPIASPKFPERLVEWLSEADPQGNRRIGGTYSSIECESYSTLKRMVQTSNCISLGLKATVNKEVETGELAVLPIKTTGMKTNAGIAVLKDRLLTPLAKALTDEIKNASKGRY